MGMRGNIMHINNLLGVDQEQWDSLHMITGIGRSGNIIGYINAYIYIWGYVGILATGNQLKPSTGVANRGL